MFATPTARLLPRLTMQDSSSIGALRDSLAAAVRSLQAGTGERRLALKTDVQAFVFELRGRGWPPERVIIAIKELAHEVGLEQSRSAILADRNLDGPDALIGDVIRWCIECYYSVVAPDAVHRIRPNDRLTDRP